MADYYPLLARAVSSLPQNTAEARKAVFDRARTALLRQLRGVDPPLPEGEITRERLGLEEAIRRIEAEYAAQDNASDAAKDAAAPENETSGAPAAPEPKVVPDARTQARAAARSSAKPAGSPAEDEADAEARAKAQPLSAPAERTVPDPSETEADAKTKVLSAKGQPAALATESAAADETKAAEDAAGDEPARTDDTTLRRGAVRRGEVRSREPVTPVRPSVRATEPRKASGLRFILLALLVLVVLGGIGAAVVWLLPLSSGSQTAQTAPAAAPAAPAEQPKSEDRVASSGAGETPRRAPAAPTRAVGAERAVLLEESPGGTSPPQQFEGTVTWKTETFNAGAGLPPDIGLRGEIVIPERQISVGFVLRRNMDQTLPASHTIEISFKLPPDFAFGGVANVPGVRAKPSQQAQGVPLAGLAVKVSPTLFLIGLSPTTADRQRNSALLQLSPWLDMPVIYTNNKKAVLVFEKGQAGQQAFNDVFSAWGELIQPAPEQQQAPAEAKPAE